MNRLFHDREDLLQGFQKFVPRTHGQYIESKTLQKNDSTDTLSGNQTESSMTETIPQPSKSNIISESTQVNERAPLLGPSSADVEAQVVDYSGYIPGYIRISRYQNAIFWAVIGWTLFLLFAILYAIQASLPF